MHIFLSKANLPTRSDVISVLLHKYSIETIMVMSFMNLDQPLCDIACKLLL